MPTLSQLRAADAYRQVHSIATDQQFEDIRKKYGSLARSIPSMIQINGLGPTLAFLRAKAGGKENQHKKLYSQIETWLNSHIKPVPAHNPTDFLVWITEQDTNTYHMATLEAIEYCAWLKRFAEAEGIIGEEEED